MSCMQCICRYSHPPPFDPSIDRDVMNCHYPQKVESSYCRPEVSDSTIRHHQNARHIDGPPLAANQREQKKEGVDSFTIHSATHPIDISDSKVNRGIQACAMNQLRYDDITPSMHPTSQPPQEQIDLIRRSVRTLDRRRCRCYSSIRSE